MQTEELFRSVLALIFHQPALYTHCFLYAYWGFCMNTHCSYLLSLKALNTERALTRKLIKTSLEQEPGEVETDVRLSHCCVFFFFFPHPESPVSPWQCSICMWSWYVMFMAAGWRSMTQGWPALTEPPAARPLETVTASGFIQGQTHS